MHLLMLMQAKNTKQFSIVVRAVIAASMARVWIRNQKQMNHNWTPTAVIVAFVVILETKTTKKLFIMDGLNTDAKYSTVFAQKVNAAVLPSK